MQGRMASSDGVRSFQLPQGELHAEIQSLTEHIREAMQSRGHADAAADGHLVASPTHASGATGVRESTGEAADRPWHGVGQHADMLLEPQGTCSALTGVNVSRSGLADSLEVQQSQSPQAGSAGARDARCPRITSQSADSSKEQQSGELLRDSMNQLTLQLRGMVQSLGHEAKPQGPGRQSLEVGPASAAVTQNSPGRPLKSALAQSAHRDRIVDTCALEDALIHSSAALSTTATEMSATTREPVEGAPPPRASSPTPKRAAARLQAAGVPITPSRHPTLPEATVRVPKRESAQDRLKQLDLVAIPRSVAKNATSDGGGPAKGVSAPGDGMLNSEDPVVGMEVPMRDVKIAPDGIAGIVLSGDETTRTRSSGWYTSERAKEFIHEIQREAAHKMQLKEEKERKRQEQLMAVAVAAQRRIQSEQRARHRSTSAGPNSAVSGSTKSAAHKISPPIVNGSGYKAPQPPPQVGGGSFEAAPSGRSVPPARTRRSSSRRAASSRSARRRQAGGSRSVDPPGYRRPGGPRIGSNTGGGCMAAGGAGAPSNAAGTNGGYCTGSTIGNPWISSHAGPRDSFEEPPHTESETAWTEPEADQHHRMVSLTTSSVEEPRNRFAASLSDGEKPRSRSIHSRLAARIRTATRDRARDMRQAPPYYDSRAFAPDYRSDGLGGTQLTAGAEARHLLGHSRAVSIGITYSGMGRRRPFGNVSDCGTVSELLVRDMGLKPADVHQLRDDELDKMPTRANILAAIAWLVHGARAGSHLFFHFSGYIHTFEDAGEDSDRQDMVFAPCDYQQAGLLSSTELRRALIDPLPGGSRLVILCESADWAAGFLDLPFSTTACLDSGELEIRRTPDVARSRKPSLAEVVVLCGCRGDKNSSDLGHARTPGPISASLNRVLSASPCVTYAELLTGMSEVMRHSRIQQVPVLISEHLVNLGATFCAEADVKQWDTLQQCAPAPQLRPPARRALTVGINYLTLHAGRGRLSGCINASDAIKGVMTTVFGFHPSEVCQLRDDQSDAMPTRMTILHHLRWLVEGAQAGDDFFFHFSGHSGQMKEMAGDEHDGKDPSLLPCDFRTAGPITDDELYSILVTQLPRGCRMWILLDCCHSGLALDLSIQVRLSDDGALRVKEKARRATVSGRAAPEPTQADIIMISGCKDMRASSEMPAGSRVPLGAAGAVTFAFNHTVTPQITCLDLMRGMHAFLRRNGFAHLPKLTSEHFIDFAATFVDYRQDVRSHGRFPLGSQAPVTTAVSRPTGATSVPSHSSITSAAPQSAELFAAGSRPRTSGNRRERPPEDVWSADGGGRAIISDFHGETGAPLEAWACEMAPNASQHVEQQPRVSTAEWSWEGPHHAALRDRGSAPEGPGGAWSTEETHLPVSDMRHQTYLTASHRLRIDEVLAQQRRARREVPPPPPEVSVSPFYGESAPLANRPPSRGGESWQPLGQTMPPAYEEVTPEVYEQHQQLIGQLLPSRRPRRGAPPSQAGIPDDGDDDTSRASGLGEGSVSEAYSDDYSVANYIARRELALGEATGTLAPAAVGLQAALGGRHTGAVLHGACPGHPGGTSGSVSTGGGAGSGVGPSNTGATVGSNASNSIAPAPAVAGNGVLSAGLGLLVPAGPGGSNSGAPLHYDESPAQVASGPVRSRIFDGAAESDDDFIDSTVTPAPGGFRSRLSPAPLDDINQMSISVAGKQNDSSERFGSVSDQDYEPRRETQHAAYSAGGEPFVGSTSFPEANIASTPPAGALLSPQVHYCSAMAASGDGDGEDIVSSVLIGEKRAETSGMEDADHEEVRLYRGAVDVTRDVVAPNTRQPRHGVGAALCDWAAQEGTQDTGKCGFPEPTEAYSSSTEKIDEHTPLVAASAQPLSDPPCGPPQAATPTLGGPLLMPGAGTNLGGSADSGTDTFFDPALDRMEVHHSSLVSTHSHHSKQSHDPQLEVERSELEALVQERTRLEQDRKKFAQSEQSERERELEIERERLAKELEFERDRSERERAERERAERELKLLDQQLRDRELFALKPLEMRQEKRADEPVAELEPRPERDGHALEVHCGEREAIMDSDLRGQSKSSDAECNRSLVSSTSRPLPSPDKPASTADRAASPPLPPSAVDSKAAGPMPEPTAVPANAAKSCGQRHVEMSPVADPKERLRGIGTTNGGNSSCTAHWRQTFSKPSSQPWDADTSSSASHEESASAGVRSTPCLNEHRDSEDAASSATDAGSVLPDAGGAPHPPDMNGEKAAQATAAESTRWPQPGVNAETSSAAGRIAAPGRTPHSEEEGDVSSGASASNAWLGSPGRTGTEGTALKDMMRHSKHKHMIRKLIPSWSFPSPEEPPLQHSAPSSTRSLGSNSSSSSSAAASNAALESDRFTRFTCDLAKKIVVDEEARASMVEQLFRLQQRALEKKVREKLRHLKAMETEKSPRWVEKRMRKIRMRAEAEHAEIERQLAESKAVHARRKLRLSEMEHQVYSWRSSTLKLKKKTHNSELEPRRADDAPGETAVGSSVGKNIEDASPFSSGYSTPSSGSSMKVLVPPMPAALTARIGKDGAASSLERLVSMDVPEGTGLPQRAAPAEQGGGAPVEHALATERSSATDRGNITERSTFTARSSLSEQSSTGDAPMDVGAFSRQQLWPHASQIPKTQALTQLVQPQTQPQQPQKQQQKQQQQDQSQQPKPKPHQTEQQQHPREDSSQPTQRQQEQRLQHEPQRQHSQEKPRQRQPQAQPQQVSAATQQPPKTQSLASATPKSPSRPPSQTAPPSKNAAKVQTEGKIQQEAKRDEEQGEAQSTASAVDASDDIDDIDEGKLDESSINSRLRALRGSMEATRLDIQTAKNLKESARLAAGLRVLQKQKEATKRLWEQKQRLINERVRLIQLGQESREVDELLDKALKLDVDEEVQRQITETRSEKQHAGEQEDGSVNSEKEGASPEWEARESHLERLREQIAEKRRAVEELAAERRKLRQTREEQRLLKELQEVKEQEEQLRQPMESDEDSQENAWTPTSASVTVGISVEDQVSKGQPIPDAIDADLEMAGATLHGREGVGVTVKTDVHQGKCETQDRESIMDGCVAERHRSDSTKQDRGVVANIASVVAETQSSGDDFGSDRKTEVARNSDDPQGILVAPDHQSSCSASTSSVDDHWRFEDIDVTDGKKSSQSVDWQFIVQGATAPERFEVGVAEFAREACGDVLQDATERQVPLPEKSSSGRDEAAKSTSRSQLATTDCAEQGSLLGDSTDAMGGVDTPLLNIGEQLNMADPLVKSQVADEMVEVLMDVLIEDSIHSAQGAELQQPTPVSPAAVIKQLIEDGVSSGDSEPAAISPAREPTSADGDLPEDIDKATSGASSSSEEGADANPGHTGEGSDAANGTRVGVDSSMPPSGSGGQGPQTAPTKDGGPTRPPSPPADALPLVATAISSAPVDSSCGGDRTPCARVEAADRIAGELFDSLLGEMWEELGANGVKDPNHAVALPPEALPSATTPPGVVLGGSPNHSAMAADATLASSSPQHQPRGIRMCASIVRPFLDAAMEVLGVADEESEVLLPVKPVDSWFPAVLDLMHQHGDFAALAPSDLRSSEPGCNARSDPKQRELLSWARLLADALVEVVAEEVVPGPRVLGWRRPGFGTPPLARFRAQQAAAGLKQTWSRIRTRLEEVVKFGFRANGGDGGGLGAGGPPGSNTDEMSHGPGMTLVNIDEGIDALLEEEICSDEANWLDIGGDVRQVKNQVVQMLFADLIDETVAELKCLWSL